MTTKNRRGIRRVFLSLGNQAVSSATTFVLNIFLIKILSPEQFGLFGLGFSVCLLMLGVASAMFLMPMVVNLPSQRDRAAYCNRMLGLTCAASLLLAMCGGVWLGIGYFVGAPSSEIAKIAPYALVISAAFVAREYYVRLSYSEGREALPIVMSFAAAMALVGFHIVEEYYIESRSAAMHLSLLGVSIALGATLGALQFPQRSLQIFTRSNWRHLILLWPEIKWSLLGVAVIWMQTQAFLFIAAYFSGLAGVGAASASRLFVSPVLLAMPALAQVFLPKMAEMAQGDRNKVWGYATRNTKRLACCAAIYGLAAIVVVENSWISFGDKYMGLEDLVKAWCFVLVAQVFREGASTALLALRSYKSITLINILTVVPSLGVTAACAIYGGTEGIIIGAATAEFSLGCALWYKLRRITKNV